MRWMIGLLLVANLILFLWWNTGQQRVTAPAPAPRPDIGSLQLLSEVGEESAADQPSSARASALPPPTGRAAPGRERALARLEDDRKPTERPAKGPEPQDQPSLAMPVPPQPKTPVVEAPPQAAPPPAPAAPKAEQACWELGPFEDDAQLPTLRLPKGVERLTLRHSRIRVPSGFYVLIPAQKDRKSARAVVRRLKQKGVRDFWLFNAGPLKNAISLGMFSREKNAQQRRDEIARLGFPAEVHARHRTLEGTVLHLKGPKSAAIERQLRSISAGQMRPITCPQAESP